MTDQKFNRESPNVQQLIPQQLVGNSTALIEFLKEYYRFLNDSNQKGPHEIINHITQNRDLDKAVDAYIDMVRKEIGYGMARNLKADKINLYKRIGEFYRAKGSIDSFKLLFRILFNKNVEISLPKEQILIASDGRWVQQTSIFSEIIEGNPFDLVNTFVDILNTDGSTVKVEVERVRKYNDNDIYEIIVSRFFVGTISNKATFTSTNGVTGTVINSLSDFTINYPGKKFKVGQLLDVAYGQALGTKIKVTSVNSEGGITGIEFLSFGVNYQQNFTTQLVPVGFDYSFTENSVDNDKEYVGSLNDQIGISEYMHLEINPYCFGFAVLQGTEYVRINNDKYFAEDYLEGQRTVGTLSVPRNADANIIQQNSTDTNSSNSDTLTTLQSLYPNRAIVSFTNTPLSKYSGFYATNNGFLSDDIYLQDNHYYQQFSYVIKTDEQFSTYEGIVKQTIHPAGMAIFGEFEITNEIDASNVTALLAALFRTNLSDIVSTFKSYYDHNITKPENEEVFTSQFVLHEFTKPIEDEVIHNDIDYHTLAKSLSHIALADSDIKNKSFSKPLVSEAIAEDSNLFEDPNLAYALDYFRQDYTEGLTYNIANGFHWELTKPQNEEIFTSQLIKFENNKSIIDTIITPNNKSYKLNKPLSHSANSQNENYSLSFNKVLDLEDDVLSIYDVKYSNYDDSNQFYVYDIDDYFLEDYTEGINIPLFGIDLRKQLTNTVIASENINITIV